MSKKINAKKELRNTLKQKLSIALVDYKNILQEKKYERSLKRASRLLSTEILDAMKKEAKQASKDAKKPAKKKTMVVVDQQSAAV